MWLLIFPLAPFLFILSSSFPARPPLTLMPSKSSPPAHPVNSVLGKLWTLVCRPHVGHSAMVPYEARLSGMSAVCVWCSTGRGLAVLWSKHGWPDWGHDVACSFGPHLSQGNLPSGILTHPAAQEPCSSTVGLSST